MLHATAVGVSRWGTDSVSHAGSTVFVCLKVVHMDNISALLKQQLSSSAVSSHLRGGLRNGNHLHVQRRHLHFQRRRLHHFHHHSRHRRCQLC